MAKRRVRRAPKKAGSCKIVTMKTGRRCKCKGKFRKMASCKR